MKYTRKYLDSLRERNKSEEANLILQSIADGVSEGEKLSLAEWDFYCNFMRISRRIDNNKRVDLYSLPECKISLFRLKYMIYHDDLDGTSHKEDFDGAISLEGRRRDVIFLNDEYKNWIPTASKNNHADDLLNQIVNETQHHIKNIRAYCKKAHYGGNREEYFVKSITLHGKLIYYIISEFYEEASQKEEHVHIGNETILIDSFVFVHTLFRHYSAHIKEHQLAKTYHYDTNINYKELPAELKNLIEVFKNSTKLIFFNQRSIYLKIRDTIYAIWLRPIKKYSPGNIQQQFLRVQTFYPVLQNNEKEKLRSYQEIAINDTLAFLIPSI